ncbi:17689_t:CDS:1, partial [Acaulospora morrowiae]
MSDEPSSSIEYHPIILDVDERLIEELIMSHDNIQEEEIEKVKIDSKLKNVQNRQIETILVKEPNILILNKELSVIATTWKNQNKTDKIRINQKVEKESVREPSESTPMEIVQRLEYVRIM